MDDSSRREMLRLVELDYERTSKFIEGIVGTGATIRGWAITIWVALLGAAVDRKLWELAALGAVVILVFGLVDGYHASLYRAALDHAMRLERITRDYYAMIGRGTDDPDAELDLRAELESHRFGYYSNLRRFELRDLRNARPWVFFKFLYPFLAAVGAVSALLIAVYLR